MAKSARGIQSVEVSGRILKALVESGEPMMLKDMAQAADLKPAQCHAYLTSLKNIGFVHQDASTGLYAAGALALRLGVSWMESDPLMSRTIRELKTLTEELGVMSLVTVWGPFGPTIVHIYAGLSQAALNLRQGSLFSITGTAAGRVFGAYCHGPDITAKIEAELAKRAQSAAFGEEMSLEDFKTHVSEIRAQGYSIAEGRPIPGLNAVAVPMFSPEGKMSGVASLIGEAGKLSVDEKGEPVRKMLELAAIISTPNPDGLLSSTSPA